MVGLIYTPRTTFSFSFFLFHFACSDVHPLLPVSTVSHCPGYLCGSRDTWHCLSSPAQEGNLSVEQWQGSGCVAGRFSSRGWRAVNWLNSTSQGVPHGHQSPLAALSLWKLQDKDEYADERNLSFFSFTCICFRPQRHLPNHYSINLTKVSGLSSSNFVSCANKVKSKALAEPLLRGTVLVDLVMVDRNWWDLLSTAGTQRVMETAPCMLVSNQGSGHWNPDWATAWIYSSWSLSQHCACLR